MEKLIKILEEQLIELFNAGAKNSTIKNQVVDLYYFIPTYGWDKIVDGIYYKYDNKTDSYYHDRVISINDIVVADEQQLDRNYYRHYLTSGDIAELRRQYRVS